jgi:hypothetical protein
MVKFFLNLLAFAPLFATLTTARNYTQVNYFYDNACSDFASSPPNVPNNFLLYNWETTGTNSAGIANCEGYEQCQCWFYTGVGPVENDTSALAETSFPNSTCVTGHFASFSCQYG